MLLRGDLNKYKKPNFLKIGHTPKGPKEPSYEKKVMGSTIVEIREMLLKKHLEKLTLEDLRAAFPSSAAMTISEMRSFMEEDMMSKTRAYVSRVTESEMKSMLQEVVMMAITGRKPEIVRMMRENGVIIFLDLTEACKKAKVECPEIYRMLEMLFDEEQLEITFDIMRDLIPFMNPSSLVD